MFEGAKWFTVSLYDKNNVVWLMNVLSPCQLFTFFSINFGLKKRKYNRQITKKINMA